MCTGLALPSMEVPVNSDMQGGKLETKAGIWAGISLPRCLNHPIAPETFSLLLLWEWRSLTCSPASFPVICVRALLRMTSRADPGCLKLPAPAPRGSAGSVPSHPTPAGREGKARFPAWWACVSRPSVPWCRSAAGSCHCQPGSPGTGRRRNRAAWSVPAGRIAPSANRLDPGDTHIWLLEFFSLVCLLSSETPRSCTCGCHTARYRICGGKRKSTCPAARAQKSVESAGCIWAGGQQHQEQQKVTGILHP